MTVFLLQAQLGTFQKNGNSEDFIVAKDLIAASMPESSLVAFIVRMAMLSDHSPLGVSLRRQLFAVLLTVAIATVAAANGNIRFDPDADGNTVPCTITPYTDLENYFQPKEGQCASAAEEALAVDLDSLRENNTEALHHLAVHYAPVIFFHPLEKYTLSSVNYTFSDPNRGKIYLGSTDNLVDDQLNLTTLLRTTRDHLWSLKSTDFYFTLDEYVKEMYNSTPDQTFGDGFDASTGKSKASIYYNVFDSGNGTWAINYWLYYEYNGEVNMGVVTAATPGSSDQEQGGRGGNRYTRFLLKPYGIHEGDWEAVSVMICPPSSLSDVINNDNNETSGDAWPEPLAVHYRQHSWGQITDCTKGECKFYKETHHPVAFSALNSHATYVDSAEDIVYVNFQVGFLFNFQAYLGVDRTVYKKADGTYNYFMPSLENLEPLQQPQALVLENAAEMEPYFWQAFGGNWGSKSQIAVGPQPPQCLAEDQLSFVDCPTPEEDPVFDKVMQVMDVREASNDALKFVQGVSTKVVQSVAVTGTGPVGPMTKDFYQTWVKPKVAPFWSKISNTSMTGEDYCANMIVNPNAPSYAARVDKKQVDAVGQATALVATVGVLTVFNFVIPLLLFFFVQSKGHYKPIRTSEVGAHVPPTTLDYVRTIFGMLVFSIFFIIMMCAGSVFLNASKAVFDTLERYITGIDWEMIAGAIRIFAIVILIINTLLLVFLWLQAYEVTRMVYLRHQQLSGTEDLDKSAIAWDQQFVPWNPTVVDVLFRFCFAILFLSLMLSMLCVCLSTYAPQLIL